MQAFYKYFVGLEAPKRLVGFSKFASTHYAAEGEHSFCIAIPSMHSCLADPVHGLTQGECHYQSIIGEAVVLHESAVESIRVDCLRMQVSMNLETGFYLALKHLACQKRSVPTTYIIIFAAENPCDALLRALGLEMKTVIVSAGA